MIRFAILTLLVTTLALHSRPAAAQQKTPTLDELLDKLEEKRNSGGVHIYKLDFELTTPQKIQMEEYRSVQEYHVDWRTGKYRQSGWDAMGSEPNERIEVYDGEKLKMQFRDVTREGKQIDGAAWKYGILTGRMNSSAFDTQWWPVFLHKGVIGSLQDRHYPGHLTFDSDAAKFMAPTEVVRDGRKCISLKTIPEDPVAQMQLEYILDPRKDYSVVGCNYSMMNILREAIDINVGPGKQAGRWALNGWTYTSFERNGVVELIIKVKVLGFSERAKAGEDGTFDLVAPEGTRVGRSHYHAPRERNASDLKRTSFRYEVKHGKLVQIEGPESTAEWWVTDHWRSVARQALLPAATMAVPRLAGRWSGSKPQ